MKVVLKTLPVVAAMRGRGGTIATGALHFEAQAYSPGEDGSVWQAGQRQPATAAEWLKDANSQGMVVVAPPPFAVAVPPVEVPAGLLRSLPADTLVAMEWTWEKTT